MTEFVPLGEQIEMEEVLAEPTADRVRIVHESSTRCETRWYLAICFCRL